MNLDFLKTSQERDGLVTLLARTGNSRLLPAADQKKIGSVLSQISAKELNESCAYLQGEEIKLALQKRSQEQLKECLGETIKSGNASVVLA